MKYIYSLLIALVLLSGCASKATVDGMTTGNLNNQYDKNLENQISISSVNGGESTNPIWTSEIDNSEFQEAIIKSLISEKLYSQDGRYKLSVQIIKVEQPMFGLDLEVTVHSQYVLTDSNTKTIILNKSIVTPYTATIGDSFIAIKRLRLANEGAGKSNIEALLKELSKLNIDEKEIALSK